MVRHDDGSSPAYTQAIDSLLDVFLTKLECDTRGEETPKAELYRRISQLKIDQLKKFGLPD